MVEWRCACTSLVGVRVYGVQEGDEVIGRG